MKQETLSPLGKANEAEVALASIAMTEPTQFLTKATELGFSSNMVLNTNYRAIIEACLDRAMKGLPCDIMLLATELKTTAPELKFHELSEIGTSCPIVSALPEFIGLVKSAFHRRTLQEKLSTALLEAQGATVDTKTILGNLGALHDDLTKGVVSHKAKDTRSLLGDALNRYEHGEDKTSIVSTGFNSLDNITPIRYGDMLVIGGEPKAGKTMLALNIISNILMQDQL
jgi:replicative DNA helicase